MNEQKWNHVEVDGVKEWLQNFYEQSVHLLSLTM